MEKVESNRYSYYTDLSPSEYSGLIEAINHNHIEEVRQDVEGFLNTDDRVCIIVVGSDGKLERHAQSPTEIVMLKSLQETSGLGAEFSRWYRKARTKLFSRKYLGDPRTGFSEVKIVDGDVPLSYAFDNPHTIYPDRVLNTQLVAGNEAILHRAKEQVLKEMTGDDPLGRRVRDEIRDQLRQYRRSLETGEYRRGTIFTLDPPQQFYNEDPNDYRVGFKISALRTVQRSVDLLVVRAIRSGMLTIDQVAAFPSSTLERIDALREVGIIDMGYEINEAYSWFLQQYHFVQEKYKNTRQLASTEFSFDDFLTHKEAISSLVEEVKKLGKITNRI